jgi:hypothetical protein
MTRRIHYMEQSPELFKKFVGFSTAIKQSSSIEVNKAGLA